MGLGNFSITSVSDTHVAFAVPASGQGEVPTLGSVDRVSGSTVIYQSDSGAMIYSYKLACKRADPLF
jgi:hypothetical protein